MDNRSHVIGVVPRQQFFDVCLLVPASNGFEGAAKISVWLDAVGSCPVCLLWLDGGTFCYAAEAA